MGSEVEEAEGVGEAGAFWDDTARGSCPTWQGRLCDHGSSYGWGHSLGAHVTCDFKGGKILLQQPVPPEEMTRLLATGKTALLENFVSNKTRRKFKAFLSYDRKEGRVVFEFEPRAAKAPAKTAVKKVAAKKSAG